MTAIYTLNARPCTGLVLLFAEMRQPVTAKRELLQLRKRDKHGAWLAG